VFFLEEFRIRGAAAFADFLLDDGEELRCSLKYGIAASISRTVIAQQGFESFGIVPAKAGPRARREWLSCIFSASASETSLDWSSCRRERKTSRW
jgi:hypothetical protein